MITCFFRWRGFGTDLPFNLSTARQGVDWGFKIIRQFLLMREAGMPLRPIFGGNGFEPAWMGWMREGGSPDKDPEVWRRTKGLRMYMANYDGIAEYVWYEGYHIWNDFVAAGRYKNFNIVYPTRDGVIDTVAWEALREAFDDVRYATLLKQLGTAAMAASDQETAALGRQHIFWLESTDPETVDLDDFREGAAGRIATLARRLPDFRSPAAPWARFAPPAAHPADTADTADTAHAGDDPEARAESSLVLARNQIARNFHDQAVTPLLAAAATQGISKERRARILLDLAGTHRVLGNDTDARKIYREILDGGEPTALVNEAFRGLLETVVCPAEYDWVPTPAALDEALAIYDEILKGGRLTSQAAADLVVLMTPAFIAAGKAGTILDLGEKLLAAGALPPFRGRDAARLLESLGDACVALGQHARAVAFFDRAEPAGQLRLLEKIGDNARMARNFRRAQQAYADMIPLIDKNENKSLYNRISRRVVQLTKGTRASTATTAQEVFDTPDGHGTLTLEE